MEVNNNWNTRGSSKYQSKYLQLNILPQFRYKENLKLKDRDNDHLFIRVSEFNIDWFGFNLCLKHNHNKEILIQNI